MWLALYLPALPLQAFSRSLIDATPVVVFQGDTGGRRTVVVARNRTAARCGVRLGASLAEAASLAQELVQLRREPLREAAMLHRLAHAVSVLTPNVHVSPGYGLLLDVAASLRLLGGPAATVTRAQQIAESLQLRLHSVVAPTALGARWLSRAHRELVLDAGQPIAEWLDDLSLDCTDLDLALLAELHALNLSTVGDVHRLPERSLQQRFGATLMAPLSQAYGGAVTVLPFWSPPKHFEDHVEFTDLAREQEHWMPGVVTLLERLERYLVLHAAATVALTIRFREGRRHATDIALQAAFPMHSAPDWQRLLTVKLQRQAVAHEVSRIELRCAGIEPMQFANVDLFDRSQQRDRQWAALAAMVRLRLGERSMRPALVNQGILPESIVTGPDAAVIPPTNQAVNPAVDHADIRPTWLVDPPRALSERELKGLRPTLQLHQPERLHEDWSQPDGAPPIERDYYVASTTDDRLWWVFRERPGNQWFLQGIFG